MTLKIFFTRGNLMAKATVAKRSNPLSCRPLEGKVSRGDGRGVAYSIGVYIIKYPF